MRVRFIETANTESKPTTATHTEAPNSLHNRIQAHIQQRHGEYSEHIPDLCAKWLQQYIVSDVDSQKKYYFNQSGICTRIKIPALVAMMTNELRTQHQNTLQHYIAQLESTLQSKGLRVATICDAKDFAVNRVNKAIAELKAAGETVHKSTLELLNSVPAVHLDACKDCVAIGDTLYIVTKRATLEKGQGHQHHHTRKLPSTFTTRINNRHISIPSPAQIVIGSALLCNRMPAKLVVNVVGSATLTDSLLKLGADLVIELAPKQKFTKRSLRGVRIIIVTASNQLQRVMSQLDEIGALVIISNPKNKILAINGYHSVTVGPQENIQLTSEWLIYGATPGEMIIPSIARQSSEIITEAVKEAVTAYTAQQGWSPVSPDHTAQLRLILPHLPLQQIPPACIKNTIVADAFKSLGYRVNRPTNRIMVAYSMPNANVSPPMLI
jgi:hypothetical protein